MRIRILLVLLLLALRVIAADPASDWLRVTELDAGPGSQPKTLEEARAVTTGHLDRQEKALRAFLAAHPDDAHAWEAKLRLARLLQIRATFQSQESARAEASRLLDELEASATGAQRAEVDFARVTFLMRTLRAEDPAQREALLARARRFQSEHAGDRRVAALLAEVSTLFDRDPETQRSLVVEAQKLTSDAALKSRLSDDLRRLSLVGQPVSLRSTGRGGKPFDLATYRGKPVVLVFFGMFSPPSTDAVTKLQQVAATLPKGSAEFLGVALDGKIDDLAPWLTRTGITWPIAFDAKGWNSPAVRALGINRLPTVWLLDKEGRLRSLNALEDTAGQLRGLTE